MAYQKKMRRGSKDTIGNGIYVVVKDGNVEKAIKIAKENNLIMVLLNTSRWQSLNDPLMPKKKENIFIRKELYEKAEA